MAHASVCGESYRGLCDSLKSLSPQQFYDNFLRELDFTLTGADRVPTLEGKRVAFSDRGELESSAEYDVWSFSNARGDYVFTKVGCASVCLVLKYSDAGTQYACTSEPFIFRTHSCEK